MARDFCAWCHDALWKDVLKANPAVGTHRGAVHPDGRFQLSLPCTPKTFWQHEGSCRPWPLLGWSALSRDWWVPVLGAEQRLCLWDAPPHLRVWPNHFGEPPWWFACMYGQEACLGEVLWCCRTWPCPDRRRKACASSLFPGVAAKAPEQLLYVNSFVFWQFCTITSCLYRLSQTVSASVSSLGFLLLPFFLSSKHFIRILLFSSCCSFSEPFYSFLRICMENQDYKIFCFTEDAVLFGQKLLT